MKILITGTAGRIGRAIYIKLIKKHSVVGVDRLPCSTADYIGDIRDLDFIINILKGVDVIIHTAALHAPHVNLIPDKDFYDINVKATETLFREGIKQNIKHFIFTSTTALYGWASTPDGRTGWINEEVIPMPKTIYHKTKIEAENRLEGLSNEFGVPVTVLQMSRCFPEPADLMAMYRLNRGIDARDVAEAHALAVEKQLPGFRRFIISGSTPFNKSDLPALFNNSAKLLEERVPGLVKEFKKRNWLLSNKIDRVYDSSKAQKELDWHPKYGYEAVLEMLDSEISEVLPVKRTNNQWIN